MPSATARRLYEDQIPSFMSVFDVENGLLDPSSNTVTVVDPKMVMEESKLPRESQPGPRPGALPSESVHKHNDSTSTAESADSSPTTTVSCTDSSDLSDPSPSSSPDSPVNLAPLRPFAPTSFGGLAGMANLSLSGPTTLERPMTSPAPRRPKNMKGLSIQPPFGSSLSSTEVSEPSSPSFIKPKIPTMKRKPSQLSLKTSTSDLIGRTTLEIPSSPSVPPILQRRALKHSTSSPHMLSGLKSATFGPAGGMTIPTVLERNESGLSSFLRPPKPSVAPGLGSTIVEEDSPIRTQIANRVAYEIEPFHEVENNEDQKTPGYPDGPIAIYGDEVYLYLEPTAEEASRFDVVINVAREVSNPFKVGIGASKQQQPNDEAKPADDSPIPDTAATGASFATALEYFPEEASADTPTTPKAQSFKEPEYIHMPWDHNTDIGQDLMSLCETIERRTKEGKKVLVHCQQGASRSASLIIAYGLYQNPELSVNDAYYAAQSKSRWISPNMRLMYCLQDFQKENAKRRLAPSAGFKPRTGRSPTKHRATLSADHIELPQKEPLTAPLPVEDTALKSTSPDRNPSRARGNSSPNRGEPISPGPSSAPSSFSWTEKEDEADPGKFGRFNIDSLLMPSQPDSGFASSVSSLSRPPPSPGFPPPSITRAPPSPGFGSLSLSRPPPSPGFGSFAQSKPPQSPGFGSFTLSKPPRSPGPAPISISRMPPSPGLAPLDIARPPMSPGFPPPDPFSKPPPSPGFGAHRFGSSEREGTFGFAPLHFTPPPKPLQRQKSTEDNKLGFAPMNLALPPKPLQRKKSEDTFGFAPLSLTLPPKPVKQDDGHVAIMRAYPDDAALLSPRAEVMTNNPLHQALPALAGMQLVEVPPTPSDGVFSPRETMFPRDPFYPFGRPMQNEDPRSPPTLGETPIVRSIDELL
ncbi:dual specificity phosphatase [Podospora australis]|uniref:protein-tyrosine-phosphatase n=1 Tax=Podospora australis TaxID=1536484 RepID=A0AAN6WQ13_9PEZI|nr:dual specificity phosphatase [Podospora australis]